MPPSIPRKRTPSCHTPDKPGRRAEGVNEEIKQANLKRLRRIEGQVRGLHAMLEQDRYCADVIVQVSAIRQALRAVGRQVMRNHLEHCATHAIRASEAEADRMYAELLDLMDKNAG